MKSMLCVKGLTKIFGPNPRVLLDTLSEGYDRAAILEKSRRNVALYNVSLDIEGDESVAIAGLVGSGKSTLLRCLNLMQRPTAGEILFRGQSLMEYSKEQLIDFRRRKVAMLQADYSLFPYKSVLENAAFGLELQGMPKKTRRDLAMESLELLGVGHLSQVRGSSRHLDMGERQRIALARALTCDPEIILMDDPFVLLDPIEKRELQLQIIKLQKSLKKAVIFTTRDPNEAFKLGARIVILNEGRVVQTGYPDEILKSPADDFVKSYVMDIDKTRVITARSIMTLPTTLVFENAGPHWAIKEMKANGLSSVFVVNSEMRLRGLITIDGAVEAINSAKSISDVLIENTPTASPDTSVNDLMPLASNAPYPISIVDEGGRMLGLVTRVAVISSLMGS